MTVHQDKCVKGHAVTQQVLFNDAEKSLSVMRVKEDIGFLIAARGQVIDRSFVFQPQGT